jgi:adenylate cyclase
VMLAALSLERRLIYGAAVVAAVCVVGLASIGEVGPSPVVIAAVAAFSVVVMALASLLAATASRRTVHLVSAVAEAQRRRGRLGRYFSPQVTALIEARGDAPAAGEIRDVTVLFSDLRGFTALGERLSGPEVVVLLNDFHERMVAVLFASGGTLDKYLGDGLMAYFGAPVAVPDHPLRAVRCALAMHGALAELRTVGDAVNVAARLEALTTEHGASILVSDETRRRVGSTLEFTPIGTVHVRGKLDAPTAWTPLSPA